MAERIRVNSAEYRQLLALPGVGVEQADRIVRFRREHGPIANESELSRVLGWRALDESMWGRVDFSAERG
ncbi:MAG TPA: helix-hairpin-helix domain-containing protein [Methylomirabilota bacterium]|nr:helix-hairpin-helix domain-containing protein [Methylomirabilota bacterium]